MSEPVHKDYAGAKLGMWLFLYTEVLLFGGLFVLYSIYLWSYPVDFARGSNALSLAFGAGNTLVLLTSSLFAAMAVTALQTGKKGQTLLLLGGTIVLALAFLVNKYFEWSEKFHHGLYPDSPVMNALPPGEILFYGLYFITTGLHGIHVLIGGAVLAVITAGVKTGSIHSGDYVKLENAALYWHLVDIVWIFIFPLYYLIL